MVQLLISIPSSKQKQCKNGRYTAYCIESYLNGKCHKVDRRYSEFFELHRTLKKCSHHQLPNLPPKKVRNLSQKFIEQRRNSLEEYLKHLLKNVGLDKAKELNDFLNVPLNDSPLNSLDKQLDSKQHKFLFKSIMPTDEREDDYRNFNFHQCMIGFKNDYLFSIDYDLPSYLTNSLYSDSSSNKSSNCETNSCTSTSSSTSGSLPDIVVMGALDAIYDRMDTKNNT